MMNIVCSLKNISKNFGERNIFSNINFSFEKNKIYCIVGISGSGKSSLLKIIASLDKCHGGDVVVSTQNSLLPISYAFQTSTFFPWLTIYENLELCLLEKTNENKKHISELLAYVGLEAWSSSYPLQLSAGMLQKANLVRSFLNNSDLILMDEPFAQVDFFQRGELQKLSLKIQQENKKTMIFVTHDIHEALKMGDEILIFSKNERTISKSIKNNKDSEEMSTEYIDNFRLISKLIQEDSNAY